MKKNFNKHLRSLLLFCCFGLFSPLLAAFGSDPHFPVPDNIRPAVNFWVKVYTEVDTNSGFLHDPRNLDVIYASLSRDRDTINAERERIRADLLVLASGRRTGLTASQQHILSLWPAGVSNEVLAEAAENVRWQLGQSDRYLEGLQRSGAYRDHIDAVILAKNMPLELGVLPHVESSFHPGAFSSAAASGMWQFIRATAQRFMRVDYVIDDRLDPYTATHGAMALLEYNYSVLGTWPLALTAYNHGTAGMARAVRDTGTRDIGQIIDEYRGPRFGFASRNFYPQFLAALEVERRAEEFFGPVRYHSHPGFHEHELDGYVDAAVLAHSLGVSVADLRRDNPALLAPVWSGSKRIPRGYKLKVRRDQAPGFDLLAGLGSIPANQFYREQIPDLNYVVRAGDSLSVIAGRYNTTVSELVAINQLRDRHTIRVGQTLLLPQPDGGMPSLVVGTASNSPQAIPDNGVYEVRRGDSLSLIAERFRVSEADLLAWNNISNSNLIYPGQALQLRAGDGPAPREPAVAPAPATAVAATAAPVATPAPSAPATDSRESVALVQLVDADFEDFGDSAIYQDNPDALAEEVSLAMQTMEAEAQLVADLSTDPTDYSVAADGTIEIQAIETLGHYADWLGLRAWDIRRLNGMEFDEPVRIGSRLRLDFSRVDRETFEYRRQAFHRDIQQQYFANWRIEQIEEYSIRQRDYLDNLTRQRSVPMWLFRQYNPDVDVARLQIGQVIVFPVVERVEDSGA